MFSYKNMANASLLLLKCVYVADIKVLFIKGDMKCYQWWQIVIAVFFFTWILFFPLSLKVSFSMFMKDKISFAKFILCLMFPFAIVANYRLKRNFTSVDLQKSRNTSKVFSKLFPMIVLLINLMLLLPEISQNVNEILLSANMLF